MRSRKSAQQAALGVLPARALTALHEAGAGIMGQAARVRVAGTFDQDSIIGCCTIFALDLGSKMSSSSIAHILKVLISSSVVRPAQNKLMSEELSV